MSIERSEAETALGDIAGVEERTRKSLRYVALSSFLILWGVLWVVGNGASFAEPAWTARIWIAVNLVGIAASIAIDRRQARERGDKRLDPRVWGSIAALMAFGVLCSFWLVRYEPRALDVFWPILAMLGYVLAGLWIGPRLAVLGIVVILLSLAGYAWLGPWLKLWMAAIGGGALILGGLWLRRAE